MSVLVRHQRPPDNSRRICVPHPGQMLPNSIHLFNGRLRYIRRFFLIRGACRGKEISFHTFSSIPPQFYKRFIRVRVQISNPGATRIKFLMAERDFKTVCIECGFIRRNDAGAYMYFPSVSGLTLHVGYINVGTSNSQGWGCRRGIFLEIDA